MDFLIYLWIYTLSMIIIWCFFIISKIHSLTFKSYQPKIIKITNVANLVMITLTILGYIFIFLSSSWNNIYTLEDKSVKDSSDREKRTIIKKDIWDDYY